MNYYLKLFFMSFACCCLLQTSCWAYTAVLEWNPNSEPDLAGYIVYYGKQSRSYENFVDVGNSTNCSVGGLVSGVTYYFAVKAYDTGGLESYYSDEVSYSASNSQPQPSIGTSNGGGACFVAVLSDISPNVSKTIIFLIGVLLIFLTIRVKKQ